MAPTNLFVYGTLLAPEVTHALTKQEFRTATATLEGYQRYCVRGEVFPGIIPQEDALTHGKLLFDVGPKSQQILDWFEGDFFDCCELAARTDGKEVPALAYVVAPQFRDQLSRAPWDYEGFRDKHLQRYARRCQQLRNAYLGGASE